MNAISPGETANVATVHANASEHIIAHENGKIAHGLHTKAKKAVPKTAAAYWINKVHKPGDSPHFNVQMHYRGERHRFPLETAENTAAAEKARERFLYLVAHGWPATLAHFKPETVKQKRPATLGEWMESVKASSELSPSTLTTYCQCLRQIAAEIEEIGDQPALDENGTPKRDKKRRIVYLSRFDYRAGGRDAWTAKVDALPLSVLTAAAVQRWKVKYTAKAGNAPDARQRAANSAATLLRCARSLFSAKIRKYAAAELTLPDPLPFAGVELPKKGSTTYQSKIDAATLIESANAELEGEVFKVFCLGLLCGLRKREIDLLMWQQVDFSKGVIRLERTEFFEPKSEESIGEVDLDPELLTLLQGWKAQASGAFVIESTRKPKHAASRTNYRCQMHFEALYAWLRKHGITARKPLHELRKELGAILASTEGIFAAKSMLRHAQISTTAAYYTDKKRRITAGLGALLTPPASNVIPGEFAHTAPNTKPKAERIKA